MAKLVAILQRALGKAWIQSSEWIRSKHTVSAIADRIERGQPLDQIVEDIRAAAEKFAAESNAAYTQAGRTAAESLDAKVPDALVRFDVANERAVRRARVNQYELREGVTAEQQQVIRRVLVAGRQRGANPRELARDIRDSIGLTAYQEQVVRNYRRELESGLYGSASNRRLVNGTDTRSLTSAQAAGRALSPARIDALVERYRQNWIGYRAETIARTESQRAAHDGSEDLYSQAIERGDVDADELVKEWHCGPNTADARPDHREMRGVTVGVDEDFVLPDGVRMRHPGDPRGGPKHTANCRCTFSVTYRRESAKPVRPKPADNRVEPRVEPKAPRTEPPTQANLTADEYEAARTYQGGEYRIINAHLRGVQYYGEPVDPDYELSHGKTIAETVAEMDQLVARAKLPEPVTVYRGTRDRGYVVGDEIVDRGYPSTSRDRSVAEQFAGPRPDGGTGVVVEIELPRGAKALDLSALVGGAEDELLLPRGTRYRVVEVGPGFVRVELLPGLAKRSARVCRVCWSTPQR